MQKKSFFLSKLAVVVLLLFFAGCSKKDNKDDKIALTTIDVSPAEVSLTAAGETQQLTATAVPANASDVDFKWKSDSEAVATVSNDGLVTAVAAGSTTVTVTSGNVKRNVPVTVTLGETEEEGWPLSFDVGSLNNIEIDVYEDKGFTTLITVGDDPHVTTTALGKPLTGTSGKFIFECITNRATAEGDEMQIFWCLGEYANSSISTRYITIPKCDAWTKIEIPIPADIFEMGFGSGAEHRVRIDPVGIGGNWNKEEIVIGYEISIRKMRIEMNE
jgi:hypothetical protein